MPSAGSHRPRIRTTGFLGPALGISSFEDLNRPGVAQPARARIAAAAATRESQRVIIKAPHRFECRMQNAEFGSQNEELVLHSSFLFLRAGFFCSVPFCAFCFGGDFTVALPFFTGDRDDLKPLFATGGFPVGGPTSCGTR